MHQLQNSFSPSITGRLSRWLLKQAGWELEYIPPKYPKLVIIVAPHTSNWDFVIGVLIRRAIGLKAQFIGKDTLFRGPMGKLMRALGGIPVKRGVRTNFVQRIVELFKERENLIISIAPEGTRKKSNHWKSGFYYIALKAGIPIGLAYLDYSRRRCGIGAYLHPTGNVEADLGKIREFYSGKIGKYPENTGEVRFKTQR